ncbi:MAG: hypothetical protein ACI9LV_000857 [Candidatus Nanohaloarchaea archaeon]|jgi:hypothetical protein
MKKIALALLILLTTSSVSADIESSIKSECSEREVSVISISDPQETYSHPAEPDYYDENLCISGIENSQITEGECDSATGMHLTGRGNESHFSVFDTYRLSVCTDSMETRVAPSDGSCRENETALFSVSGEDNAHVAAPGVFDQNLCGGYVTPENVSLSIEFNHSSSDNVVFSGENVEGEQTFDTADYPYLVSEGNSMVAGIVKSDFRSASRRVDGENILVMKASRKDSTFILPFTQGGSSDIQNREQMVADGDFLSEVRPSFGYLIPESPTVRVIYDPDIDLDSNISFSPGTHQFDAVKTGEDEVGLLTPDERTGN